jgi:hypothetical protein
VLPFGGCRVVRVSSSPGNPAAGVAKSTLDGVVPAIGTRGGRPLWTVRTRSVTRACRPWDHRGLHGAVPRDTIERSARSARSL